MPAAHAVFGGHNYYFDLRVRPESAEQPDTAGYVPVHAGHAELSVYRQGLATLASQGSGTASFQDTACALPT